MEQTFQTGSIIVFLTGLPFLNSYQFLYLMQEHAIFETSVAIKKIYNMASSYYYYNTFFDAF